MTERNMLIALRRAMAEGVTLSDLEKLCQKTGVDFGNIPGDTASEKSTGIVDHFNRRSAIPDLLEALDTTVEALEQAFPRPPVEYLGRDLPDAEALGEILNVSFSKAELKDLCFDLGVDYGNLESEDRKEDKCYALVEYMQGAREGWGEYRAENRFAELADMVEEHRPHLVPLEKYQANPSIYSDAEARHAFQVVMAEELSLEDIESLCGKMGVAYDNIPGASISAKTRGLIEYSERHGCSEVLAERLLAFEKPELQARREELRTCLADPESMGQDKTNFAVQSAVVGSFSREPGLVHQLKIASHRVEGVEFYDSEKAVRPGNPDQLFVEGANSITLQTDQGVLIEATAKKGVLGFKATKLTMTPDGIIRGGTVKINGQTVGQGEVNLHEHLPPDRGR